jgi:hypothetical protein
VAWKYTPRQLNGWLELSARRKAGEQLEAISVAVMGTRADNKVLKKETKRLVEESR